jgi:predicted CXXCH cytochrome family protein
MAMKSKVQFLKQSANTVISAPPREFYGEVITIGRATTQDIFLADPSIALEHARIRLKDEEQIYIEAVKSIGIDVNGHIENKTKLKVWDKITLGPFVITVMQPPKDCALYLVVEQSAGIRDKTRATTKIRIAAAPAKPEKSKADRKAADIKTEGAAPAETGEAGMRRLAMDLSQTTLSKRRWSWWALLIVFSVFLLSPLATLLGAAQGLLAKALPNDTLWNTGRISHVHQHFGNQCRACHTAPFEMVSNETCIGCHRNTRAHTAMDHAPAGMSLLENGRCGRCHKEHNETLSLKPSHQALCVNCHGDLDKHGELQSALADVTDFGENHPEFRPTVLQQGEWWRIPVGARDLAHEGGLKFSHAAHLKAGGVDAPDGKRVLDCGDCHRPEPGGAYMLPVDMKRDCQTCHRLNFDPAAPDRTVPHGDLPQLLNFLNEFYALQALKGGYESADAPVTVKRRRRPDERVSGREQQDALHWAETKAQSMIREVVETRTCATCHTVTADPQSEFGWTIDPVHQPARWLRLARFSHAKHDSRPCAECHAAKKSERAEDVLLPGIEDCRSCHGGAKAQDKYASTCTVCHKFHLDEMPPYGHAANDEAKPK